MKARPKPINDTLNQLIDNLNLRDNFEELYIKDNWDKVLSPPISKVAKPINLKNHVLTIRINDLTWKKELQKQKASLLKMINSKIKFIHVKEIIFS